MLYWESTFDIKVADFIGLLIIEWCTQNKVGNINILVFWRDLKKTLIGSHYLPKQQDKHQKPHR